MGVHLSRYRPAKIETSGCSVHGILPSRKCDERCYFESRGVMMVPNRLSRYRLAPQVSNHASRVRV